MHSQGQVLEKLKYMRTISYKQNLAKVNVKKEKLGKDASCQIIIKTKLVHPNNFCKQGIISSNSCHTNIGAKNTYNQTIVEENTHQESNTTIH
jgi:hypothetical protein